MKRALAIAMLLCAVSTGTAVAQATPSDADRAAALAMLQAGIQSAEDGDWESARVAFTRAYTLVASTRVLMNLAGAQRHTGRLRDARESYRRWLIDATDRDASYRPTIEQALSELESEIPTVTVTLRGAINGDVAQVDGGEVEVGATVELDPGPHTAEVVRGGRAIESESFTIALGERRDVLLTLPSLAPTDAAAAVTTPRSSLITEREHDDVLESPWLWVGVGAGAVVLISVIIGVAVASGSSSSPAPDMGTFGPYHL